MHADIICTTLTVSSWCRMLLVLLSGFWTIGCVETPDKSNQKQGPETALGQGKGELDPASVTWTPIVGAENKLTDPRDLGFDPDGNLWIANRSDDHTFIVSAPGTSDQEVDRREDGYSEHFMEETSAFSFERPDGAGDYGNEFGSCGESENTYNGQARKDEFMGPVLWSADLDIFAKKNPYGLGSHLDMLHQSPLCVGIAWESDNIYWVFDGYHNAIVRNDFQQDHGIGQDDHSDGIVDQLSEPTVTRVENAPGHMMINAETGLLYVADTGGGRVLQIDTASGDRGKGLKAKNEPLDEYATWNDVDWAELVTDLDQPGGLALGGGLLYVAEYGTGVIHVFDMDGNEIQSLDTGRGAAVLYGIEVGPDGKLWVIDHEKPSVFRLDPD